MATVRTLKILGVGNQAGAPSAATDLARLQELAAGLATKADLVHTHGAGDITDLAGALGTFLQGALAAGYGLSWSVAGSQLSLGLVTKPNGGVLVDGEGLYLDAGAVSAPGHTHGPDDVVGLAAAVAQWLAGNVGDGATVEWTVTGAPVPRSCPFSLEAVLLPGATLVGLYQWNETDVILGEAEVVAWGPQTEPVVLGLMVGGELTGDQLVIPVGPPNTNVFASVALNRTVPAGMAVQWQVMSAPSAGETAWHCMVAMGVTFPMLSGTRLVASVVTSPTGGLQRAVDGLAVDRTWLTGVIGELLASDVWRHAPLTVGPSGSTVAHRLAGQELTSEVILQGGGGLVAGPGGLSVDTAWLAGQLVPEDTAPLTVQGDASLALALNAGVLTGAVQCDPAPGAGRGRLEVGAHGVAVVLGTDGDTAAAGDHGHAVATPSQDGFMSAAQAGLLAALGAGPSGTLLPLAATDTLQLDQGEDGTLSGAVRLDAGTSPGQAPLGVSVAGLYVPLGTGAHVAAAGNHTHAGMTAPTGTGFRHVAAGVEDGAARLVVNADVAAGAAIAESKLALAFPTHDASRDPAAGEKAALAGTDGTPSDSNRYVTDSDPRLGTGTGGTTYTFSAPLTLDTATVGLAVSAPLAVVAGAVSLPAATATVDGYLTKEDKAKLDALTGFAGGLMDATLEFAGGLNPAMRLDALSPSLSHWDWLVNDGAGETLDLNFNNSIVLRVDGNTPRLTSWGGFNSYGGGLFYNDTQVVGAQGLAVSSCADPGGAVAHTVQNGGWGFASEGEMNTFLNNVASIATAVNTLLTRLRAHGLIAS